MLGGEAHGDLELVVALDHVGDRLAPPVILRADEPAQPRPQAVDWHGIIAPMHQPLGEQTGVAFAGVPATQRHIPRARVAVEIRILRQHVGEDVEVFGIAEPALRRGVRGDHRHAAFQRLREVARVGESGRDDWHRVLAAGVREERQPGLGHALPKAPIARVVAIDVVAVRQQLQHHRASSQAALQLIERIGARGVDGDGGEKLGMLAGEPQHVVIRHMEGARALHLAPARIIDLLLREDDGGIERRLAHEP